MVGAAADLLAIGAGASFAIGRGFSSDTFGAVMPDSCVLVREYIGGAIPAIPGLLVGDIGLVIGVSLVVRPAQCEMASCHLAASSCELALKAKSCFVNPYVKERT